VTIINNQQLQISLSEKPENDIINIEQIIIPNLEIIAIEFEESLFENILLTLSEPIEEDIYYSIHLENVTDCWGNISLDSFTFYSGFFPAKNDIVFNEIMADPTPQQLLPEAEFIELYNRTEKQFNISGWRLENSGVQKPIPNLVFEPNSYIILCREADTNLFLEYGKVVGLESWVTLANTEDSLALLNEIGQQITQVAYKTSWYKDGFKANGGWSLERINANYNCNGSVNWMASENVAGGTPGMPNSVINNEIENDINLWQTYINDSNYLVSSFTGEPDIESIINSNYNTNPDLEINLEQNQISDNGFELIFSINSEITENAVYQFNISNIKSCNMASTSLMSRDFGLAFSANRNDITINEILFHPYSGASDFIELTNTSEHFIDISKWRIQKIKEGIVDEEITLSDNHLIIAPSEYLAISSNPEELLFYYPKSSDKSKLFELSGLPNFDNESGTIVIKDNMLNTIDSVAYSEQMHFSLLDELNGVSLEKINPDGSGNDPLNWTSASELSGFATPGMPNSQMFKPYPNGEVLLTPELFTPNNDGINDLLHIQYKLTEGGWMGTIKIYNDHGVEVRKLLNNDWLGTEGSKAWDGTDEYGSKAPVGIYIVYFDLFNAIGEKQQFKKVCVLGAEL